MSSDFSEMARYSCTVDAIHLRNVRRFVEPATIELSPLTIMVGPNSAGKSTVRRAAELFLQSSHLSLEFDSGSHGFRCLSSLQSDASDAEDVEIGVSYTVSRWGDAPFEMSSEQRNTVKITFTGEPEDTTVFASEVRFWAGADADRCACHLYRDTSNNYGVAIDMENDLFAAEFLEQLRSVSHEYPYLFAPDWEETMGGLTEIQTGPVPLPDVEDSSADDIYERVRGWGNALITYLQLIDVVDGGAISTLEDSSEAFLLGLRLITVTGTELRKGLPGTRTVEPYQAKGDPVLPVSDRMVSLMTRFAQPQQDLVPSQEDNRSAVREHLREFGIGESLQVDIIEGSFAACSVVDGARVRNLCDLGDGDSQTLWLLLTLWRGDLMFLVEPEATLHPRRQSEIATLLTRFTSPWRRVLVETHSEYLVRRLQLAVAEGRISSDLVKIYYADSPPGTHQTTLVDLGLDEHGKLSESFGHGFLDESTALMQRMWEIWGETGGGE